MYCLEMVYALEARTTYKCELSHAQYYAKIPKQLKLPEGCGSRNNQSSINAKEKLKEGHLPSESEEEPSLSPPPFLALCDLSLLELLLQLAPAFVWEVGCTVCWVFQSV